MDNYSQDPIHDFENLLGTSQEEISPDEIKALLSTIRDTVTKAEMIYDTALVLARLCQKKGVSTQDLFQTVMVIRDSLVSYQYGR